MTELRDRATELPELEPIPPAARGRLGLNLPREWWPTPAILKGLEAAGFTWVQVHAPPRMLLRTPDLAGRHAAALRSLLDLSNLRLVLHGPDDLGARTPEDRHALAGLMNYAERAGASIIVYHAPNLPPMQEGWRGDALNRRLEVEEYALRRVALHAQRMGAVLAVENLAPVYPSAPRLSHDPLLVGELVRRVGSPAVGLCLDLGHAHISGSLAGRAVHEWLEPARELVVLFHAHDNLGARSSHDCTPGVPPVRLDLHLPPGAGTLAWGTVASAITSSGAPVLLEVAPPHRPPASQLAQISANLLFGREGSGRARGHRPGRFTTW